MNREYLKWMSKELHRPMEMLVFGHSGRPVLVFPTSMGRFFEYEDREMIEVVGASVEAGKVQYFCVDSVDLESWYNKSAHPRDRVRRHLDYERYIINEVLPLIRSKNPSGELTVTGCSFGGYHAVNFALRHPDLVSACISMSGGFDIHRYLDGYYDDECYFNCPPDFLPNLTDNWYLEKYRNGMQFFLGTSERDICLDENLRLSGIMNRKDIPHWLDVWGDGAVHDWPLWRGMAVKLFG